MVAQELGPETILLLPVEQDARARLPGLEEGVVGGPGVGGPRSDHRAGGARHQLVGGVLGIRADKLEQPCRMRRAARDFEGDEPRTALSERDAVGRPEVRPLEIAGDGELGDACEVGLRPQLRQRPDDSGRADPERRRLQRIAVLRVCGMQSPETAGLARGQRRVDDLVDRRARAPLVPDRGRQRLVPLRLVEVHQRSSRVQ